MDMDNLDIYATSYYVEAEITEAGALALELRSSSVSEEYSTEEDAIDRATDLLASGYVRKEYGEPTIQIVEQVKGTLTRTLEEAKEYAGYYPKPNFKSLVMSSGVYQMDDDHTYYPPSDNMRFIVVSWLNFYDDGLAIQRREFDSPSAAESHMTEMLKRGDCNKSYIEVSSILGTMHKPQGDK